MKRTLALLSLIVPICSLAQQRVVDLKNTNLYKEPSNRAPSANQVIKPLPIGTSVLLTGDSVEFYLRAIIGTDTGWIQKHTLVQPGSKIQPIDIKAIYRGSFYLHPDLTEIQQSQTEGKVDHVNYGKRLIVNSKVNKSVEQLINTRKLAMYDENIEDDRIKKQKIDEIIETAKAECRNEHSAMSKRIWDRYSERPKFKLLPSRNAATSMMYYHHSKKTNFLSNVNVEGWDSIGSIKSEVFTFYVSSLQFSIGTMLSRITPERIDDASIITSDSADLQRRLLEIDSANAVRSTLYKTVSGGGEFSINIKYPIVAYNIANSLNEFSFTMELANSIGLDAPVAGRYIAQKDLLLNNVSQICPSFLIPFTVFDQNQNIIRNTNEKFYGLSVRGTASLVHGTQKFYETLKLQKQPFSYYSGSLALILDKLTIQYTIMDFSNSQLKGSDYNRLQIIFNTSIGK